MEFREEVVIVVRPVPEAAAPHEHERDSAPGTDPITAVRDAAVDAVASAAGLVAYTAQSAAKLAHDTASSAVNATLDAVVPRLTNAILQRVDITQIVVDNVDVNKIASEVQLDPIIDRIPIIDIADYVIEEIDLPEVIRGSTGGIAERVMQTVRFKAIESDVAVERLVDRILMWRDGRTLKAQG